MKTGDVKSLKREGEILSKLLCCVLEDVSRLIDVDLTRDRLTLIKRIKNEGLPFVTKTLPAFGKAIDIAFQSGKLQPPSSLKRKGRSFLPCFLYGLTSLVFNDDGELLPTSDVDPYAVKGLRQVLLFMKKYELPYKEEQKIGRLNKFLEVEEELPLVLPADDSLVSQTLMYAEMFCREIFRDADFNDIVPRHGPGSTSRGNLAQYDKYRFYLLDDETHEYYPAGEYFCSSPAICAQDVGAGSASHVLAALQTERTAKAVFVPKDSDGPRFIFAEPPELQWLQQGLRLEIEVIVEAHPLTRGHVNFHDQGINGRLALEASLSRLRATLDQQDASDRVALVLVRAIFPTRLSRRIEATRSTHVLLPALGRHPQRKLQLKKVSPMGSGVCFSIESVVFHALMVGYIMAESGTSMEDAAKAVYTFGDDTICPSKWADGMMETLEQLGLKYNREKSFVRGPFRESCGVDAFNGTVVTPIRLKKRVPWTRKDASSVAGWIATSNLMHKHGMWLTADFMASHVRGIIGDLPVVPSDSGAIGLFSFCGEYDPGDGWSDEAVPPEWVVKQKGPNWEMITPNPTTFCYGKTRKAWVSVVATEQPSLSKFEPHNRYLQWTAYHAGRSAGIDPTEGINLKDLPSWDGSTFSRRYSNKLRYRRIRVT